MNKDNEIVFDDDILKKVIEHYGNDYIDGCCNGRSKRISTSNFKNL